MTVKNPLLTPSPLPYELPPFADIRLEHVPPAFDAALDEHNAEIAAIVDAAEPTWGNTVEALEASGQTLKRVAAWFFNLQGTDSNEEMDAVAADIVPRLSAHTDAIYQNAQLYARIRDVSVPDDAESARLHSWLLRRFERRGAALDEAGKARLSELNQRLSVLSEQFGRNLLADTRQLAVRFDDAEELAGLSTSRVEAAAAYAAETGTDGWVLPIELPTVQSDQAVLEDPAARARLYEASQARGTGTNVPVLLEAVRLRAERARLLGYDTHADYVIAEETAGDASAARDLLFDLAPAASANAAAERKLAGELADVPVEGADWPYWESKLRERDLNLDEDELRRYFPLDQVLVDGVFFAARRLYGIDVVRCPDLAGYHDDVDVWEVLDADGTGLGLLLTDYFARPSKRGGAWMSTFVDQSRLLGKRPVVVNVLGIAKPVDGSQPLLSMDQVTTLFHEFGHGLHGLLSDVRYPSFSGTSVPRDWVEFPSQINENWAFDPAVVRNFARHVDTGEVIPDELLDAVVEARQFGQGFATSEYLAAAIIDLAWHSLTPEEAEAVGVSLDAIHAFEERALSEAGLDVEELAPRYRSTYFNHIFAGGYSAGYYSYLWAEALDADGFDWFTETGAAGAAGSDEAARRAGEKFRGLVLSKGASVEYGEAFERLRGRAKDVGPLLRRRGLAGADVR
ncbi:M3 family metallopeptidase [Corynebacterium halotolerans]|uniref:Peptidyl-dipeptidase n=1 Tax=Corynebacterium halotolerans YIM 70093 = DSM 44683 TaxID=1121362 RepID=M1MZG7_9CORY|nr:M3 family metallopeptidase [Corynebacterium halotolerans]AGF73094.1 peptidyl-dipeptidase [Corynebacterium halotolerans YIM 70093 = DSM 44683]